MKALFVGDIRLSEEPSRIAIGTYAEDILGAFRVCVDYASEHVDVVMVLLGDVFGISGPRQALRQAEGGL